MAFHMRGVKHLATAPISRSHGTFARPHELARQSALPEEEEGSPKVAPKSPLLSAAKIPSMDIPKPDPLPPLGPSPKKSPKKTVGVSRQASSKLGDTAGSGDESGPSLFRTKSIVRSRSASELFQDGEAPPVRTITRVSSRKKLEADYIAPGEDSNEKQELEDSIILNIKSEAVLHSSVAAMKGKSKRNTAGNVKWMRLAALKHYTIWMIKVIIYNQSGTGFDPPTLSLYTLPDRLELKNDSTLESYSLPSGCTLLAVPSVATKAARSGLLDGRKTSIVHVMGRGGKINAPYTFAVGRGLACAVAGFPSTFHICPVGKAKYITGNETKFFVVLERIENGKRSIADSIEVETTVDKVSGRTRVSYTPTEAGRYLVNICVKKQHICLSPYELEVRDLSDDRSAAPKLREMAFSGWELETSFILGKYSEDKNSHSKIFSVGMAVVSHLLASENQKVQQNVAKILSNLLKKEENKVRLATDGGFEFMLKIATGLSDRWRDDPNIRQFITRSLAVAVQTNKHFRSNFGDLVGWDCLVAILHSVEDVDEDRYAAQLLCGLSSLRANRPMMSGHVGLVDVLFDRLERSDSMVVTRSLLTIASLLECCDFQEIITKGRINQLSSQLSSRDDKISSMAMRAMGKVQANTITVSFIENDSFKHAYDAITSTSSIYWWEIDAYKQSEEVLLNAFKKDDQHTHISQCVSAALEYIFAVLDAASPDQREAVAVHAAAYHDGAVLHKLCQMAGCIDEEARRKACLILNHMAAATVCRKVVDNGWLLWILTSLPHVNHVEDPVALRTVASLSSAFSAKTTIPKDSMVVKLMLKLVQSEDQHVRTDAAIVLAHLVRGEKYKDTIMQLGRSPLLQQILELVKAKRVTVHNDSVKLADMELGPEIAQSQNKIYKATLQGKEVAVKLFSSETISFDRVAETEFLMEVAIMSLLNHKRLCTATAASTIDPLFISCRLFTRGSLHDVLYKDRAALPFPMLLNMLKDIASGMEYLHSWDFIHRDLKPGNLLVTDNYRVSVADFGTTRIGQKLMTPTVGTAMYMAPDLIKTDTYTSKVDVFSFGMVMWEMLERRPPYPKGMSDYDIVSTVQDGKRPVFSSETPLNALANMCWAANPADRPTFTEIVAKLATVEKMVRGDLLSGHSVSVPSGHAVTREASPLGNVTPAKDQSPQRSKLGKKIKSPMKSNKKNGSTPTLTHKRTGSGMSPLSLRRSGKSIVTEKFKKKHKDQADSGEDVTEDFERTEASFSGIGEPTEASGASVTHSTPVLSKKEKKEKKKEKKGKKKLKTDDSSAALTEKQKKLKGKKKKNKKEKTASVALSSGVAELPVPVSGIDESETVGSTAVSDTEPEILLREQKEVQPEDSLAKESMGALLDYMSSIANESADNVELQAAVEDLQAFNVGKKAKHKSIASKTAVEMALRDQLDQSGTNFDSTTMTEKLVEPALPAETEVETDPVVEASTSVSLAPLTPTSASEKSMDESKSPRKRRGFKSPRKNRARAESNVDEKPKGLKKLRQRSLKRMKQIVTPSTPPSASEDKTPVKGLELSDDEEMDADAKVEEREVSINARPTKKKSSRFGGLKRFNSIRNKDKLDKKPAAPEADSNTAD